MALRHFRFILSAVIIAAASFASHTASLIERAVLFAVDVIAEPFQIRQPVSAPMLSGGGSAGISPALYQSNRHEAGVSRRSADRNT